MGTWGTGLYCDDTTCDVRDSYVKNLKTGLSDSDASKQILDRFSTLLNDREIACLVYFALADTQWHYGRLEPSVKNYALDLLQSGGDLAVWERDAPWNISARKKVLTTLKKRLESTQKPHRLVRIEEPRPLRKRTDAQLGTVFILPLPSGRFAALALVGHCDTGYKTMEPVFSLVKWSEHQRPTAQDLERHEFIPIMSTLGPNTEIGFLGHDGRENPIANFERTDIVLTDIRPYSNKAHFKSKAGMVTHIEAVLSGKNHP